MHRHPRPARLARGSTPPLLLAASACAALTAGCLADDADDTGAPLGAATADVVISAPPLMAYRESYLQSAIVPGRPLPAPISRGVGGSFACDPTTTTLGVAESRSADGSHTYRLRCARPTARGVVEDHLALVLDERVATETDRAEARACAATFARYGTPRNEYFTATLGLGGVACRTNGSAVATMLAQSAATGGQHPGVITPGLAHPSVPANVIPAAPLEISAHAGQRATLPAWAITPAADVVMLTSDPTRPIHLAVQSRANPADLTSFDPDAYPSEIIGYTLQFATEPTATTSCATWTDVPGFIGEQFVALHDTPVAALSLPSGLPIWTHDLDVPLPYLDLGPWTDDAHLSHTFWVRAVPRGPVLGGGPGDPPPPGVPGLDASACAFTPSNWVPIGVFDDALYSQHVFAELTQQLAAYVAKQPYDPATLYEVKLLRYAPPRLVDRAPIDHTVDVFGYTFSFPTVPVVSEVNNGWGAHRGFAFDPFVLGSAVAAANSHWYDTFVDLGNLLIDALSLASELYESAKTFVADTVALVGCTQVPVDGCNDFVSGAAKLGIEYGLASMGIPPHIPNARELMDKGVDYLAAMAADEVAAQVPGGGVVAAMTARELAYAAVKQSVHDALDAMPLSQEYDNDALRLQMGESFWLRSSEANIQLDGSITVEKHKAQYRYDGTLNALRGNYALRIGGFVTKDFTVERGTVRYFGTPDLNADLDIEAKHTVIAAEGGEEIPVTARITGTMLQPRLELQSTATSTRPALSQTELVSYLMFGRPTFSLQGTNGQGSQYAAVQAGLSYLSSALSSEIQRSLISDLGVPIDYLDIKTGGAGAGLAGQTGAAQVATVAAGWQIGRRWFVSVVADLCTNAQRFSPNAEFRMSRQVRLKASVEPAYSCQVALNQPALSVNKYQVGLDLLWDREY